MLTLNPVEIKFQADMSQLKRDVDEMKRIVGEGVKQSADNAAAMAAGGMNSMLSGLTSRLAGLASLAGLQQTLAAVHTAALDAERSQLLLSGALKSTGYAAGLTKSEIEGLVQELTDFSNFDDESIREAAAALLRFRDIQGETFRETLRLAPDLAAARGDDAYTEALRIQLEQLKKLRELTAQGQVKQVAADAAKKAEEDWKRTSENIERSLTDALMRGFEGGKDAAQNFRQVLWNMFRTLVLQPLIKPIVEPFAQAASGLGQAMQQAIYGAFNGAVRRRISRAPVSSGVVSHPW